MAPYPPHALPIPSTRHTVPTPYPSHVIPSPGPWPTRPCLLDHLLEINISQPFSHGPSAAPPNLLSHLLSLQPTLRPSPPPSRPCPRCRGRHRRTASTAWRRSLCRLTRNVPTTRWCPAIWRRSSSAVPAGLPKLSRCVALAHACIGMAHRHGCSTPGSQVLGSLAPRMPADGHADQDRWSWCK